MSKTQRRGYSPIYSVIPDVYHIGYDHLIVKKLFSFCFGITHNQYSSYVLILVIYLQQWTFEQNH